MIIKKGKYVTMSTRSAPWRTRPKKTNKTSTKIKYKPTKKKPKYHNTIIIAITIIIALILSYILYRSCNKKTAPTSS